MTLLEPHLNYLKVLDSAARLRRLQPRTGLDFSSNDYLGLARAQRLRDAVAAARAAVVTPMWDEPFGLVAAEAMACGVPVIAFDRGALSEVVGDCGVLVPAGDVGALAGAMTADYGRLAPLCRPRIEQRFSMERMIDGYQRCYALAMDAGRASSPVAASAADSSCARTAALLA